MNKNKILLGSTLASILFVTACNGEEAAVNEDGEIIVELGRQTIQNPKLPEGDTFEDNAYMRVVEEELGIELVNAFETHGDEYDRQVSLALASGDIPDMMVVSGDDLEELVDNDLVEDLTDIFDEYASDYIKELYETYNGVPLVDATFDDRLMGIPSTSVDMGPGFLWLRQDWIDELEIGFNADEDPLISIDELKEIAEAFKENDLDNTGNPVGLALNYWLTAGDYGGGTYVSNPIMNALNAYPKYYLADENGNVFYGSNTEEMKQGLEILKEWYDDGIIDPQFGTRTWDDITAMIINGETGIVYGPWHLPDWNLFQVKQSNPDADFAPYVLQNEDNDQVNTLFGTGAGSFIVVRKGFSNPEIAIEIVNTIYDTIPNHEDMENAYPEIFEYTRLGVDGTARPFNVEIFGAESELEEAVEIADAVDGVTEIEDLRTFYMQQAAQDISGYIENPDDAEPNVWAGYNSIYRARAKIMAKFREDNTINEIVTPHFGTVDSLNQYYAQMNTLEEETFIRYIIGEESIDTFDAYVEGWESRGGTQVLEEMQSILDENNGQ